MGGAEKQSLSEHQASKLPGGGAQRCDAGRTAGLAALSKGKQLPRDGTA